MKTRKQIPFKIKAILQQEINSVCPICSDNNVGHFEIHHINENPEDNELANLLMLCPICHSKITKGEISKNQIISVKEYLNIKAENNRKNSLSNIQVNGNVKNSTIANTITAQTIIYKSKSKPKIESPVGCIDRNLEKRNYVKHLIDRYNEFKKIDVKDNMNYKAIYGSIIKEFKASVFQIPEYQFAELVQFLQNRINNTKQGRINKGKNIKNYSDFADIYNK